MAIFDLNCCGPTPGLEPPGNASDFDLLGQLEGIVLINAQISNSALKAGMAQEQLNGSQIFSLAIDQ
jgi:hypothetical protein